MKQEERYSKIRTALRYCFLLLFVGGIFVSCRDEEDQQIPQPNIDSLNEKGRIFMEQFKKNDNWEYYWNLLNENGVLEVNKVFMNCTEEDGFHYVVPMTNTDGVVDKVAIFPFDKGQSFCGNPVPLSEPIVVDKFLVGRYFLRDTLNDFLTYWKFQSTGLKFSSDFLPEWQGGMSRAEQRVIIFQLYFALEGETQTPWRDDVDFLSALLELYSRVFAHCPYEHYVTISDNSIVVTFRNLSVEIETDDLLPYIDSFMLQLQHFLPEIVVQNPENPWDIFQSLNSQYDLTEGIFIANPLESVWLRLQDLTSSSSSLVPGRIYKQREGSKLLPDYIPHSGNIDKSNKKCVLYSLCYALDILGINNLDEKQIWNVYLGLIGRKKTKGVVIDANYTKWLSTYVDLTPVFRKDYASHIRDGEPVIAFLPMDRTDPHNLNLHCVVIVGYNMRDEWLTYYNPTTGELHEAPSSDFIRQDVSYGLKKKERN